MTDPKPPASLTSGLLARKGEAMPAMRRQTPMGPGAAAPISFQEDLGWNDMGDTGADGSTPADIVPMDGLTPMGALLMGIVPPVIAEREELAQRVGTIKAAPGTSGRKAAFTLRLDADMHLRLRLACALQHRSAQQILIAALDQFLDGLPEIDRLADQLPRKRGAI